jgi:hypothetical protein
MGRGGPRAGAERRFASFQISIKSVALALRLLIEGHNEPLNSYGGTIESMMGGPQATHRVRHKVPVHFERPAKSRFYG